MMERKLIENFLRSDVEGDIKQIEDDILFFKRQMLQYENDAEMVEQAKTGLYEAEAKYIEISKMRIIIRRALSLLSPDGKKIIGVRFNKGIIEKWDNVARETGIGKTRAAELYSQFINIIQTIAQGAK